MKKLNVLLIGAGGVGVYFCGRLAQGGGAEVSVVARSEYETAVKNGYQVQSVAGDFAFHPDRVLRSVEDFPGGADYIILATKVLPEVDPVALLRPALERSPKGVIVLIQNGVEIEEPIRAAFPDRELISTIAYVGVSRPSPGLVHHFGSGILRMGVYPAGISEAARRLAAAFEAGGIVRCELCGDIRQVRWCKLLWNLAFNPVSVLAGGVDTRQMVEDTELENLCRKLMDEVILVAGACGICLREKEAVDTMEYTRRFPAYRTSMLQDYEAGRPLEVEAILGNPVRLARRYQVEVPRMESCYALLRALNSRRNGLS